MMVSIMASAFSIPVRDNRVCLMLLPVEPMETPRIMVAARKKESRMEVVHMRLIMVGFWVFTVFPCRVPGESPSQHVQDRQ